MNARIDFDTSKELAKFLSDKLRENPGTHQPAKLLHWIAEFQGFRNAPALKAAPSAPVLEQGVRMKLDGAQGIAVDLTEDESGPSNTLGSSVEDSRIALICFIRASAEAFVMEHIDEVRLALRIKLADTSLDIKKQLYRGEWGQAESYFGDLRSEHARAARLGITEDKLRDLERAARKGGHPGAGVRALAYLYEEATKDVVMALIRDLNTTCEQEVTTVEALTERYELRERIRKAADSSVPAWIGVAE